MMNKLIGFCGLAGSGKDTAVDYMVKNHRYTKEFFGEALKRGVEAMFPFIPPSNIWGGKEDKERVIPQLSGTRPISARYLMQTLGTQWGRDTVDPDIWLLQVQHSWRNLKNIPGFAGMVISDVRFDNEAKWILDQGGIVVQIVKIKTGHVRETYTHVSELGVSSELISFQIINDHDRGTSKLWEDIETLLALAGSGMPLRREEDKQEDLRSLIVNWANSAFPNRTITNAIQKMVLEEIPEYLMAQSDPGELADIGILLYDIANLAGIDLEQAIRDKMEINKARTWKVNETTGLLNHVKDELPLILQPRS